METFCCCIPVRFGVFILSLLTAFGGAIISAASWIQFAKLGVDADTAQKAILIASGGIYGGLALFSLFGFVGAIFASRGLVKSYSVILWINWLLTLVAGGLAIWQLFRSNSVDTVVDSCQATDPTASVSDCTDAFKIVRIVYICIFAVLELIILYACVIVSRYVDQLSQEVMFHSVENMEQALARQPPVVMQQPVYGQQAYASLPGGSSAYVNKPY
ncbi:hypothetical protein CALCODRAFT_473171 [Calocera cornea HHB12733]|uniref:Tetraspannin-domain-containing protein n=1 Tax=Calocera cornea HHB12733 TaxID=1353952 RepID=A0A165EDZ7_9BASI|nr:hypothetical protein CALCODRAFT_473171 [Calocera cornea HHB12733]